MFPGPQSGIPHFLLYGSIYYKLHSDKNKHYIVNEESDLALIKSENNYKSQKVTSSKKTITEQLAASSKQYLVLLPVLIDFFTVCYLSLTQLIVYYNESSTS